jgi:hypothetical protein
VQASIYILKNASCHLLFWVILNEYQPYTYWISQDFFLKTKLMSISTLNNALKVGKFQRGSSKSKCPLAPFQASTYFQNSIDKHPLVPPWAAAYFWNSPTPYPTLDIYRSWGSTKDAMSTILRLLCRNERDSYLKIGIRSLWVVNSRCEIPHPSLGGTSTYAEGSPQIVKLSVKSGD